MGEGVVVKEILLKNAKNLRKDQTEAEKMLWKNLRAKQIKGYKFRRQHPMGSFIADFICLEKKLVLELDGGEHALRKEKDKKRDHWFYDEGFEVLRIWNSDIFHNLDGVMETIEKICG